MHNEAQSGRPSLVNDDLVCKVNKRVRNNRRFTISDLLSESVCTMGAQDAHRGAQKTACCMCLDISDVLSQGRRRYVEPYYDRRRDMGVPYHT